ncbi:T9SS type A sorting domain-containing protein [Polaribacter litorisediminis]|uniref:T9SS type A sorting domain-containing protein n=1 Tax=Polaribacter litorisediminis TaxID=1908341 RepID=UPI001CC02DF9|nr:T9SS type A sorting domain-containing protein [Polaribacter litorisediminis]UAM98310.1 T9SS type A sorting domain-containing protein [Polaribacter litorisediminis]
MKKNYVTLFLMIFATVIVAQRNDFNNNGGNQEWSNASNWSLNAAPVATDIVGFPTLIASIVNADFTVKKIQTTFATAGSTPGGTVNISGESTLTIDVNANPGLGIENASNNDAILSFNGNVTINNSIATGFKNTIMNHANGGGNVIQFSAGSLLTLNTPLEARSNSGGTYTFDGVLAGAGALRFSANTNITFGNTSDNSDRTGDFVWVGANSVVTVNTADNGVFVPSGQKIQSNADNCSIVINGANVYKGNIGVDGNRTLTFDVNKNQNSMGEIQFTGSGTGTLNLDIDDSITELFFANSSEIEWNSGTLNITGFKEGIIKFGTDNTSLTAAQLAQISADGVGNGQTLALQTDGTLVLATSLSIEDYNYQSKGRLSFPSVISNQNLQIKVPITSYTIFNTLGQKVQSASNKNEFQEINVANLKAGIYILTIEGKVSERFIKQ